MMTTIFNDLNAARIYARAYEDSRRACDGTIAEHEMMSIALLDNGQYAVAHIERLRESWWESIVGFLSLEEEPV